WAIYRNRAIEDLMLNIKISKLTFQGLDENKNLSLQLYPNPANDAAIIKVHALETIKQFSYEIITAQGQKVSSGLAEPNQSMAEVKIETKSLPAGLYICRILVNDTVITRSLSVTH
ncbi:MAG TPA: T9SS type A sorting domain-containing protein, partial [Bacteroidia bacterium]|nr:T9SS type A sorting domain-containing protein [Bacteroidia bacterium]